jgi:hypothetical protein
VAAHQRPDASLVVLLDHLVHLALLPAAQGEQALRSSPSRPLLKRSQGRVTLAVQFP